MISVCVRAGASRAEALVTLFFFAALLDEQRVHRWKVSPCDVLCSLCGSLKSLPLCVINAQYYLLLRKINYIVRMKY